MNDSSIFPRAAFPRAAIAPLLAEPRVSAPQLSQALFGWLLVVLDGSGEWCRVRTAHDGYEGWTHAGYLDLFDPPDFARAVDAEPDVFGPYAGRTFDAARGASPLNAAMPNATDSPGEVPQLSLGCEVERAAGGRLCLPVGAAVHAGAATVVAGETLPVRDASRLGADGASVVASARAYFAGTSYQWGGVTPWGADCSGFVQTAYALHGLALPRDAHQQALVGADAGMELTSYRPGDLLFFSDRDDRRVTHVGLAAGGGRVLHVALGRGGWAEEELAVDDAPYVAALRARLTGARRVLAR